VVSESASVTGSSAGIVAHPDPSLDRLGRPRGYGRGDLDAVRSVEASVPTLHERDARIA
jgi:hypothetical protein